MLKRILNYFIKKPVDESNVTRLTNHLSKLRNTMKKLTNENFSSLSESCVRDYEKFKMLKDEIRYHDLAYGFITDMPYRKIEGYLITAPSINKLFPIILAYKPIFRPYPRVGQKIVKDLTDEELYKEVFRWLGDEV